MAVILETKVTPHTPQVIVTGLQYGGFKVLGQKAGTANGATVRSQDRDSWDGRGLLWAS